MRKTIFSVIGLWLSVLAVGAQNEAIVWTAGHCPEDFEVMGKPRIVQTALGPAVNFDGQDDAVFLNVNPLAGMEEFTIELIFRQDGNSPFEQRFLHIGSIHGTRLLFESRVTPQQQWYFDAYVNLGSAEQQAILIDSTKTHPAGEWYCLAMTASKDGVVSYVNGVEQCRQALPYQPVITDARTSIGARQNLACWFKGDLYKLRITPKVLDPKDFLQDHLKLNRVQ